MPPIVVGQTFANLADFKDALRQWAVERNWTPHILDSDSHRVRAGCRSSTDCPFRIRANYSAKRGDAKVTTVDDVHNCEPFKNNGQLSHQNIKRAETGKLKFLVETVPKLMTVTLETSIHDIIAMIEQKYGQKIPTRQAQKVKGALVTRVKGPCRHCHQMGHTRRHCPQLRASAPGPIEFSSNNTMEFPAADHGDGTYADGGLEDTYGESSTMDFNASQRQHPNMFHQHPRPQPQPSATYDQANQNNMTQTSQNGISVDPSLSNDVQQHYGTTPIPPRPTPVQPMSATKIALQQARANANASQNRPASQSTPTPQTNVSSQNDPSPARTPADTRMEASKLMQQAAQLMQQAAKMNAEAARLTASVASA